MIDQLNTWLTQPSGILIFFGAALILVGVGAIVWLAVTWPKPAPVNMEHRTLPLAYVQPAVDEQWFEEPPAKAVMPVHQPLRDWVLIPPVTDEVAPIAASLGDVPTIVIRSYTEEITAAQIARAKELKP